MPLTDPLPVAKLRSAARELASIYVRAGADGNPPPKLPPQ